MNGNYWAAVLSRRTTRRRALVGTATLAGGVALAAACGSNNSGSSERGSGLITKPVDTSKQAAKGGIMQVSQQAEPPGFNPYVGTNSAIFTQANHAYSRLLRYKVGTLEDPPDGSVEADSATAWEISPDGLQVALKLRPNHRFDQRPPTNGRPMTVEDIRWNWEQAASTGASKGDLATSVNPFAPIQSFEFPDASTIVVKLAFPQAAILRILAYSWYLPLLPIEADGKFDTRQDMRGAGPWMLTKYERSQTLEYRRNPNWYGADKQPYLDGVNYALMPESTVRVAQLRAKALWQWDNPPPPAEDVLLIKQDLPEIHMRATDSLDIRGSTSPSIGISGLPTSALRDERVRRAASMLIDRDLWIETFGNVDGFRRAGIELPYRWHSHLPASWGPDYWTDPKTRQKDLGEGAKYFQFNPAEATKLMQAAGKMGLQEDFAYHGQGGYGGPSYQKEMQVYANMLQEGGHFKLNIRIIDPVTEGSPRYSQGKAGFDGFGGVPVASYPDIDLLMWAHMTPSGRNSWVRDPLPKVQGLLEQHRKEQDTKRRFSLLHDIEKELAVQMPWVPRAGVWQAFALDWPWVGNGGVHQAWSTTSINSEILTQLWYDASRHAKSS